MIRRWVLVAALLLVVVACSDEPPTGALTTTGRVTAATGVDRLESFVIEEGNGTSRLFIPGETFDRSLEELREFVVSGSPVDVTYERANGSPDVALKLVRAR